MAKKSPADLKKEGKELAGVVAALRKKTHNFAMLLGKEGIILETDLRKPPATLRKNAKAAGGGPKGAMGQMRCKGKIIQLTVEDDELPDMVLKAAKKHFQERGQGYRFEVMQTIEEDEPDEKEEKAAEEAKSRKKPGSQEAEAPEKKERQGTSDATSSRRGGAGAPEQAAEAPAQEEASSSEVEEEAQAEDASDDLKTTISKEIGKFSDELAAAAMSANKGIAKKAGVLAETLAKHVEQGDEGKAQQVLKMLKKTAGDAKKAPVEDDPSAAEGIFAKLGDFFDGKVPKPEGQAEEAPEPPKRDPAKTEKINSELEALTKELDALLA